MNYFAYGRISTKKEKQGIDKKEQLKPLLKYMSNYGYVDEKSLKKHLFADSWSSNTSTRPNYKKMMNIVKNSHDICVIAFDSLSSLGRTLHNLKEMIGWTTVNKIIIKVLNGQWFFNPYDLKHSDYKKIKSVIDLRHQYLSMEMNEARIKAHKVGGSKSRFYGPHRRHYINVYHFLMHNSLNDTAKKYHISARTAYRIKKSGKLYFEIKNE